MGLREWVVQEYKSSHRRARGRLEVGQGLLNSLGQAWGDLTCLLKTFFLQFSRFRFVRKAVIYVKLLF